MIYHLQSNLSNGNTEENNLYNNILFTRNIHRMAPIIFAISAAGRYIMSEFGVMTLLTKGFCMLKQISMAILCVMPLFLTSCIPNYFTYSKPGIYAECSLSGVQGFVAIDTLSESCVFTYFKIDYNGTAGQNPVLASVNVLLGGKSINLATVKFEDIKGVIPDGPWDKTVVENDLPEPMRRFRSRLRRCEYPAFQNRKVEVRSLCVTFRNPEYFLLKAPSVFLNRLYPGHL